MAMNSTVPWEFSDDSKILITSHQRVEMLVNGGFHFEACAVQATVIEAMLFFFILTAATMRDEQKSESIRHRLGSLTLGGLIRRAVDNSLFEDSLTNQLDEYKDKRNFLVHHHLVELHDFNYHEALQEGDALITTLFRLVRQMVHMKLSSMGHKDAEKFRDH